jgi:hypothetical protein
MSTQFIKDAADRCWQCLEDLSCLPTPSSQKFSPGSVLALENFFQRFCGPNWGRAACPLSEREIQLGLGAYLGEVVRRSLASGCQWHRDDMTEGICGLLLPAGVVVFPMEFIGTQIARYQSGNLVQWCEAQAGLRIRFANGNEAASESATAFA